MSRVCKIKVSMLMMSSIEQARWFVREKKGKAKEEAEQNSSIPGQGQQMQRLGVSINVASLVAQMLKNLPAMWDTWRREWQPTTAFLFGEFHEQRSLVG